MADEEEQGEEKHHSSCCISHEFFKAASQNPNTIAVIHASGGARICREFRQNITTTNNNDDNSIDDNLYLHSVSPSNPSLKGDESFTFSEILACVQSLIYRIRHVLDGGDDHELIKPTVKLKDGILESPGTASITGQHSTDNTHMETTPHIVGIYIVPSVEYIVAVLSVLRCGEAFLPLDPSWPKQRILSIISLSKAALIVRCKSSFSASDSCQLEKSECLADGSGCAVLEMSMTKKNHKNKYSGSIDLAWPCESVKTRKFCYLMYTSGSTGTPKGVCGTEAGVLNRYFWMQELFPLHEEDILLFKTSISFIDHLQEFLSAILTCIAVVIPPFEEFTINPFYIADFLKVYCVSRLVIVPSVMRTILPAMQNACNHSFLKLLVFSGEVLPVSLWDVLRKLLPETSILNLYGSTEVSGDCAFFDCKRLPMILEESSLSSVPIGMPISNCNLLLVEEQNEPLDGEIYVGGICLSMGYFLDSVVTPLDYFNLSQVAGCSDGVPSLDKGSQLYFKTGDFARKLQTGELVFIGRRDRTIKVNGQRIALEEIEINLREHPDIVDVAVISREDQGKNASLIAYIVLEGNDKMHTLESHIKNWLIKRLPPVMVPNCFMCIKSLPMTSSGKVDYAFLSDSESLSKEVKTSTDIAEYAPNLLQVIKELSCGPVLSTVVTLHAPFPTASVNVVYKLCRQWQPFLSLLCTDMSLINNIKRLKSGEAFLDALLIGEISNDDDFFEMGGNSLAAAQVAYKLGINMQLLYMSPSPYKLMNALHNNELACKSEVENNADGDVKVKVTNKEKFGRSLRIFPEANEESPLSKRLKVGSSPYSKSVTDSRDNNPWISNFHLSKACSFSRCNKVVYEGKDESVDGQQACWTVRNPQNRIGCVHELWKVHLKSCVDASPLVVSKDGEVFVFIGSHSHLFLCVDAVSGFLHWKIKLEGRIECSAAIIDDFSQVVVGCFKGNIYFIDFMSGSISWSFPTQGEVKSQPVVDMERKLIWCGSYDQNLYALDYRNHRCVYHISCGGSIYGSPSINMVRNMLYVASTKGRVTAISTKISPFCTMWTHELGAPVFGSLTSSDNGNVICCSVDGYVTVLSLAGSVVWKAITGGPIFAGACLSSTLPSQVLVCSRNGSVFSFDLENGDLLWEFNIGDPITSSAYIDENMQIKSNASYSSDRLVCVCGSSGKLHVLRVNTNSLTRDASGSTVEEFAKMELPGEIFSSPVMIGGRIFIGCRDDNLHCLTLEA